jgi:hypothetical protein
MATSTAERVQKRMAALRKAGLRPIQLWVPDTRRPEFAEKCRRQSKLATQTDLADMALLGFMDKDLVEVEGWRG